MVEKPSVTTVQALGVMSLRETSQGRESNGYQYAGRCVRMAVEIGLHLSVVSSGLRAVEIEVRKITFWAVFNLETYVSRHPLSPRSVVANPIVESVPSVLADYHNSREPQPTLQNQVSSNDSSNQHGGHTKIAT